MIQSVAKSCRKFFSALTKVLVLLVVCIGLGLCFVLPMWKWASDSPKTYSVAILTIAGLALLYFLFFLWKKSGSLRFFSRLAKVLITAAGLSACIVLVIRGDRIWALASLAVAVILYVLASTLSSKLKSGVKK